LSTDIDEHVRRLVSQTNRPRGVLYEEQNITIWVKSWSQIIEDCKRRLKFFQDKLNYQPDRDSSLAHLRKTYAKYLAELFTSDGKKSEDGDNREPEDSAASSQSAC